MIYEIERQMVKVKKDIQDLEIIYDYLVNKAPSPDEDEIRRIGEELENKRFKYMELLEKYDEELR